METRHQWLFRRQLSLVSLTKILLDPVVSVGALMGFAQFYGQPVSGSYLVLSLIVFSLMFPGGWPDADLKSAWNDIVMPWLFVVGVLFLFGYATGYLDLFPRNVLVAWVAANPLLLFGAHRLARRLLPQLLKLDGVNRSAVIVGANELGCQLAAQLAAEPFLAITMRGFFDDRVDGRLGDIPAPLLGKMADVSAYARQHRLDLVYIALPMASQPRIVKLLDDLRDTTVSVYFVPDIFVSDLIQARIDHIRGIPVVAVCETPFYGVNAMAKRITDVMLAGLILLLISPVMLGIGLGVKAGSPGPVLFRQRRYGLDGEEIVIYKFRSMTVCEDGHTIEQARKGDRRITAFGAFLRRTSLDELPQFINVLQGRMSIVGPRPHAVAHNEMYRKIIKGYMIRHKVKPGITGWAQVNGLRGETETVDKMRQRIQYDIDYVRHWSVFFDLAIIMKTLLVVLRGDRNAY